VVSVFYFLITTGLGAERKACLEALDIVYFLGGYAECLEASFRGVVLLRLGLPVGSFYSGVARYTLSYARRVVPLVPDELFIRRWLLYRGYVRPRCTERGVRGVCSSILDSLSKINSAARFVYSRSALNLHVEVVGFLKGYFILPRKCDSLDSIYSSGALARECVEFVKREESLYAGLI
jgi:hypothetical protein